MKKLLSFLAVSTLASSTVGSLELFFTSDFVKNSSKSQQPNNKDISIKGKNDKNPFVNEINSVKNPDSIAFAPNGNIYVGTSNGLYKSIDGVIFQKITVGIDDDKNILSIAISPSGIIYIGTQGFLYKSTDGVIFQKITYGLIANKDFSSLSFAPNGDIYVGTSQGLYRSTNGYLFFEQLKGIPYRLEINSITFAPDGTIWVGTSNGLYKSTDGVNFQKTTSEINSDENILSIAISPSGTIWLATESGLYKSTNDGVSFSLVSKIDSTPTSVSIASDGTIWVGTSNELYKSTDGVNFQKTTNGILNVVNSIGFDPDGSVYIGTNNGLYAINLINKLLKINKPDTFDKSWSLSNDVVYNSVQKIDIKDEFVKTAKLDEKKITLPITDLNIPVGKHTLVLTLKDEYKQYANLFGGEDGQITYKLWVKTSIDKEKITYSTNTDDTELFTGLTSDSGNTNGAVIIQTRDKSTYEKHPASLTSKFNDELIDYQSSYYVQGTVDNNNNFKEYKSQQKLIKDLTIEIDGIYHLHLVDTVGNTYDSYLELGENNWKLQGKFDDKAFYEKAKKMNVTVDVHSANQEVKQEANAWLNYYKTLADRAFSTSVQEYGKGFDIKIADFVNGYKSFLDPVTYLDNKTLFAINQKRLNDEVTNIANKKLQDGLNTLPQNLNVETKNVLNKSTLDSYTVWINSYQKFINDNKEQWIKDITNVASRGFTTPEQKQKIKDHINNLPFNNYLQKIIWTPNLTNSDNYENKYFQYIELDKLQNDTIKWVNKEIPEIDRMYKKAINDAESGLNLHGYSIENILHGKQKPQTKSEIGNFADGKSYHDWLQFQANVKFRNWQFKIGLEIAIPLFLFIVIGGFVCYLNFSVEHNPKRKASKTQKLKHKNEKKHKLSLK